MKKILKIIYYPFMAILLLPVYFYRYLISPILPKTCRYYPSCSKYFIKSVYEFGILKGSYLGIKRILRCTPNNKQGFDPVLINLKGVNKWIF